MVHPLTPRILEVLNPISVSVSETRYTQIYTPRVIEHFKDLSLPSRKMWELSFSPEALSQEIKTNPYLNVSDSGLVRGFSYNPVPVIGDSDKLKYYMNEFAEVHNVTKDAVLAVCGVRLILSPSIVEPPTRAPAYLRLNLEMIEVTKFPTAEDIANRRMDVLREQIKRQQKIQREKAA